MLTSPFSTQISLPGGPFIFGALLAFLALLITLSLPDKAAIKPKVDHRKKTDSEPSEDEGGGGGSGFHHHHHDHTPLLPESLP